MFDFEQVLLIVQLLTVGFTLGCVLVAIELMSTMVSESTIGCSNEVRSRGSVERSQRGEINKLCHILIEFRS